MTRYYYSKLHVFFQSMDKLPENLSIRFRLYLNILPLFEKYLMYTFLIGGVLFLLLAIYKFIKIRNSKSTYNYPWIEDELVYNIDRKLSSYIPERRFSEKELEDHANSTIIPINFNSETREIS